MTPEVGPRLTGRALGAVPTLPQAPGGSSACTGTEEALGWTRARRSAALQLLGEEPEAEMQPYCSHLLLCPEGPSA